MTVRQQRGYDKQTNTCLLQVNIGANTQCLSKEIGVGMVIPCWRRSQLHDSHQIRSSSIQSLHMNYIDDRKVSFYQQFEIS